MSYNDLLEQIGLTKNESKVYNCLINFKIVGAGKIINELKMHRNIVYGCLEKLVEKGLISYIYEGKIKKFRAESPKVLVEIAKKNLEINKEKLKIAEDLEKQIGDNLSGNSGLQEAFLYRGIAGVKSVMNLHLKEKVEYFVLGSPEKSVEIMPPGFWEGFNLKLKQEKISVKMILNSSLTEWANNIKSSSNEIRFLPNKFDSITQINVGKSFVSIFVWTETPIVTVIYDENLVLAYKKYFDFIWNLSKK
ncbi:hypothetical protein KA107_00515 [Candidatus Pacearchaeota archaeon]|nr:hypothetical protein [Candidatus Pacearchaeota archaeon]